MILALLCNVRVCTEKSCILHLKAKQLQIINVLVYMLLCHGEDFKCSSKYSTCSIFFGIDAWMGTVAASGNNQLPCPLYWVFLSDTCYVSYMYVIRVQCIIRYYCYILLFYCYIVWCVYITHCTHISNHCNDLALNGSLIGNKHICICILFHKPVSSTPCNEQDSNLQL